MSDKFFFSYGDLSLSSVKLLFLLVMYHSHSLEIFNRKQITLFHWMMPSFRVVIEYSIKGKRGQYLYTCTFELRFTMAAYIMDN